MIKFILQLENFFILAASIYWYSNFNFSWTMFAILLLVPDILMVGYFVDKTRGAYIYNVGHTYLLPSILFLYSLSTSQETLIMLAIIWCAHIAIDRTLGFGLKYESDFKDTHMQKV